MLPLKLTLYDRVSVEEVVRRIRFQLRRQHFLEICDKCPPLDSLAFLSTSVSEVVNHEVKDESAAFQSLMSHILGRLAADGSPKEEGESSLPARATTEEREENRKKLFKTLTEMYFPAESRAPKANIEDLIHPSSYM